MLLERGQVRLSQNSAHHQQHTEEIMLGRVLGPISDKHRYTYIVHVHVLHSEGTVYVYTHAHFTKAMAYVHCTHMHQCTDLCLRRKTGLFLAEDLVQVWRRRQTSRELAANWQSKQVSLTQQ